MHVVIAFLWSMCVVGFLVRARTWAWLCSVLIVAVTSMFFLHGLYRCKRQAKAELVHQYAFSESLGANDTWEVGATSTQERVNSYAELAPHICVVLSLLAMSGRLGTRATSGEVTTVVRRTHGLRDPLDRRT